MKNKKIYDVIVSGLGGMGSATCAHLAQSGVSVLGLEKHSLPHHKGSSHGNTRVIRQAYFEHPDYVPLLKAAYKHWHKLEEETQRRLFFKTGVLVCGSKDSEMIAGIQKSAHTHQLQTDLLSNLELRSQFPQFKLPEHYIGILEKNAGFLKVEDCVESYHQLAKRSGAALHENEFVTSWKKNGTTLEVQTNQSQYFTQKLILTQGAWSNFLKSIKLKILRKTMYWFKDEKLQYHPSKQTPSYLFDLNSEGIFYGTPTIDSLGLKVAVHSGGEMLNNPNELHSFPSAHEEFKLIKDKLCHILNLDLSTYTQFTHCMYTMSPDSHFIIDQHPACDEIYFACGFSGHGFKFASVIGEILSKLALTGKPPYPIDFLKLSRFTR